MKCTLSVAQVRIHGFRAVEIEKRPWLFAHDVFAPIRAALRTRLELVGVMLRLHFGYTWATLRLHIGCTWATLRLHFGYT